MPFEISVLIPPSAVKINEPLSNLIERPGEFLAENAFHHASQYRVIEDAQRFPLQIGLKKGDGFGSTDLNQSSVYTE